MSEIILPNLNEETFKIDDAKTILEQIAKVASEHNIDFDLQAELRAVRTHSKEFKVNKKLAMFTFLQIDPKKQVFNLVWSARERVLKAMNDDQEIFDKLSKCEPISFEIYGEWESTEIPEKLKGKGDKEEEEEDERLFLWPERYRDGKIYSYRPKENAIYYCLVKQFGTKTINGDWKLLDARNTFSFLKQYQPQDQIAPDCECALTTNTETDEDDDSDNDDEESDESDESEDNDDG